jgi:hypothetical protein
MNEPLSKAYILNEYLQEVWKQNSYKEGEAVLDDWIKQARESKIPTLVKLSNSIAAYRTGILAYYKCRTSVVSYILNVVILKYALNVLIFNMLSIVYLLLSMRLKPYFCIITMQ